MSDGFQFRGISFAEFSKLPPDGDAGAANLLELADTSGVGPSGDAFGCLNGIVAV